MMLCVLGCRAEVEAAVRERQAVKLGETRGTRDEGQGGLLAHSSSLCRHKMMNALADWGRKEQMWCTYRTIYTN